MMHKSMTLNEARKRQIELRLERKRLACMRDNQINPFYSGQWATTGAPRQEIASRLYTGRTTQTLRLM
jgi:hypothetical protein